MSSAATASCSRASTASIQLLATVAAMACWANLKSASAEAASAVAAARPYRTRPHRSSSHDALIAPPLRPEPSPDICPPPRAMPSTLGHMAAPASLAYSRACSTRVAPTRRSVLKARASSTNAFSWISPKVWSQLSITAPGTGGAPAPLGRHRDVRHSFLLDGNDLGRILEPAASRHPHGCQGKTGARERAPHGDSATVVHGGWHQWPRLMCPFNTM